MYSRDGDFGQVRLAEPLHTQQALDTLFCFSGAGWHRCNDRYAIRRPQGNTDPLLLFTAKGEGQLRIDTGSWRLKPGRRREESGNLPGFTCADVWRCSLCSSWEPEYCRFIMRRFMGRWWNSC